MIKHSYSVTLLGSLFLLALVGCGKEASKEEPVFPTDPDYDFFAGEVRPQSSLSCFAGAYYRKAVSSKDKWLGIEGKVKLPVITFDPERANPDKPGQYLDNPSVYMGGNANGQETDIGLTWEVIRDEYGNVTSDRRAFRPFLRRTAYSPTGQKSDYMNAPAEAAYYWYEGEEVTMSLQVVRNGIVQFIVDGAGKRYEIEYACDGYRTDALIEFKRVNAIDQVANEGKPAQATATKVENSVWTNTYLWRNEGGEKVKASLHLGRFTDMRCPAIRYFTIATNATAEKIGGESITIDGGK